MTTIYCDAVECSNNENGECQRNGVVLKQAGGLFHPRIFLCWAQEQRKAPASLPADQEQK